MADGPDIDREKSHLSRINKVIRDLTSLRVVPLDQFRTARDIKRAAEDRLRNALMNANRY